MVLFYVGNDTTVLSLSRGLQETHMVYAGGSACMHT
jgi:hypothetical protein